MNLNKVAENAMKNAEILKTNYILCAEIITYYKDIMA